MSKKTALITGAGSGIGRATAQKLANHGIIVILIGRYLNKLEETKKLCDKVDIKCFSVDISHKEEIKTLFDHNLQFDYLINNAGVTMNKRFEEVTEEELIKRIIEYKKFKEISKKLKENYTSFSKRYFKNQENIKLPKQKIEKNYEKNVIPDIYQKIWNKNKEKINLNAKNIEKIAITDNYTVASKVKEMFRVLVKQKRFVFNRLFSLKQHNKQEVVTAFSGLLELSRRNKVLTKQDELFGDIEVEKAKKTS